MTRTCLVEKKFLKILQNSLKTILAAICTLIKFQAKSLQLYWKKTPAYVLSWEFRVLKNTYFVESRRTATFEISSKNQKRKRREKSYPKCNERFTEEVINQNLQKLARNECHNLKCVMQRLAKLTALAAKLRKHDMTGNLKVKHFEDSFWMWISKIFKNSKSPSGS